MLENYIKQNNGVIKQVDIKNKINYDFNYVNNSYNFYGEKTNYMSYLRLGYLIGTIGYIPNTILDVGYGNGNFLKTCSEIIPNCYGNDINDYKLPKTVKYVSDILSEKYEVITFFDSLEHFENIDFIKDLKCDFIMISLPWCTYESDEWFEDWKHRRPDEHIYHFNEISLENFMKENGYQLINFNNIEDTIRKSNSKKNILTGVFKKNVDK